MNNKYFLLSLLIVGSVHAETIDLTCSIDKSSFNLLITTQKNKQPKVYLDDVDRDSVDELGISKLANFTMTNSQIKFDVDYEAFKKTYPNGVVSESGFGRSTYQLNRTTGTISIFNSLSGGLKDLSPNSTGQSLNTGLCSKRKLNKF